MGKGTYVISIANYKKVLYNKSQLKTANQNGGSLWKKMKY